MLAIVWLGICMIVAVQENVILTLEVGQGT